MGLESSVKVKLDYRLIEIVGPITVDEREKISMVLSTLYFDFIFLCVSQGQEKSFHEFHRMLVGI